MAFNMPEAVSTVRGGVFPARGAFVTVLAEMGHTAKRAEDAFFYGSAKAIEILPSGNFAGAGDHRREAFALGY